MGGTHASGSAQQTVSVRFAGKWLWPTVRWGMAVLRRSPLLLVAAVAASSLELFVGEGEPVRWVVTFLGTLFVTAFAAIVANDTVENHQRSSVAQVGAALIALPRLAAAVAVAVFLVILGVILPILFIRVLGLVIALGVIFYLIGLFQIVFPAVVLDGSIGAGRTAFSRAQFLAFGLVVVFAVGRVPIVLISPTPAEPVLATVLAVWAGLLTAVSTLAYTRVYIAHSPRVETSRRAGSGDRADRNRSATSTHQSDDGWNLSSN